MLSPFGPGPGPASFLPGDGGRPGFPDGGTGDMSFQEEGGGGGGVADGGLALLLRSSGLRASGVVPEVSVSFRMFPGPRWLDPGFSV